MKKLFLILFVVGLSGVWAQRVTDRRTAEIRGGGGDGKCTVELTVDDVAEVEIRGRDAKVRTVSGSPASFRRFECNQELPNRPSDFRFKGVDGRGRQNMVRSASDGGRAVIRIEDSKGGSEGYTFDIFWSGGGYSSNNGGYDSHYDQHYKNGGGYNNNGGGYNNNGNNGGWNNGWGNGNGWVTNGSFNYEGGRRGAGSYRDRNGRMQRLDNVKAFIGTSGIMAASFQSDNGPVQFIGKVESRQDRRVICSVKNDQMTGTMEIEMGSYNSIKRIRLRDINLNWSN